IERVHSETHHDNAADGLALAVPLRHATADIRPEGYRSEVPDQHGDPVFARDGDRFQIRQRSQVTHAPHHVLRAFELNQPSAHLLRAVAALVDHVRKWNAEGTEFVRVQSNLILPDKAADARNLRDSWNRLNLIAKEPILKAAQIG